MSKTSALLLLFSFFYLSSFSQPSQNDSLLIKEQVKETIQSYNRYNGAESDIYTGPAYIPFILKKDGFPFFNSKEPGYGWVRSNHQFYDSLQLQYDISTDQLVLTTKDKKGQIRLNNEEIDSFQIQNATFIRLAGNLPANNRPAFYQILYNGKVKVWASRKKDFMESVQITSSVASRVYTSKDKYYIFKDNKYYSVGNKKQVYDVFSDKKSIIKSHLRKQKIKFTRNNLETALAASAAIYDQAN